MRSNVVIGVVLLAHYARGIIDRSPISTTAEINSMTQVNCSVSCRNGDPQCTETAVKWYVNDDRTKMEQTRYELAGCEFLNKTNCIISILEINVTSVEWNGTALQCSTVDGEIIYNSFMAKGRYYKEQSYTNCISTPTYEYNYYKAPGVLQSGETMIYFFRDSAWYIMVYL